MESLSDIKIKENSVGKDHIDSDLKQDLDEEVKLSKKQIKREKNKEKWSATKVERKKIKKVKRVWSSKLIIIHLD